MLCTTIADTYELVAAELRLAELLGAAVKVVVLDCPKMDVSPEDVKAGVDVELDELVRLELTARLAEVAMLPDPEAELELAGVFRCDEGLKLGGKLEKELVVARGTKVVDETFQPDTRLLVG